MAKYRLNPETFEASKQELARRLTITGVILTLLVGGMFGVIQLSQPADIGWPFVVAFIMAISIVGSLFGYRQAFRRLKSLYDSYELTLDADSIGVRSPEINMVVPKKDIRNLYVTQKGDIQVRVANQGMMATIPTTLERFDDVKASLMEVVPTESVKKSTLVNPLVAALVLAVPFLIAQISQDLLIVVPCAIVIIGISAYMFRGFVTTPNLTLGTKLIGLLPLLFICSMLVRILTLLVPILKQNAGT